MTIESVLYESTPVDFPVKEDIHISHDLEEFPEIHKSSPGFFSELFRDLFFLPINDVDLHGGIGPNIHQENIYRRFWFENNPNCVYYGQVEDIKKQFDVYNQKIVIDEPDGSKLDVHFRVYETKIDDKDDRPFANLIVYGGNISTLNNNLGGNLSEGFAHVDRYLDKYRLRILNFSVYDINYTSKDGKTEKYKPHCMNDLSVVMANTLKTLSEKYDKIEGLICHSLTCIVLSKAFEFLKPEQLDILPKFIVFDRGSSSVKKASKNITFGDLLLYGAEYFGWSNQEELQICNYFLRCSKQTPLKDRNIWVISVEDDPYFKDPALDATSLRYLKRLGMSVQGIYLRVPLDKSTTNAHHARPRNEIGPLFRESVSDMILTKLHQEHHKTYEKH